MLKKKISNLLVAGMKVTQNQKTKTKPKKQLTFSEMAKEEKKGCINDLIDKVSIF